MERAERITKALLARPIFRDFSTPVNANSLDGYTSIVKKPMDLSTVLKNLENRRYATPNDWLSDITLVFQNAIDYWGSVDPGAVWGIMAQYGVTELDRMTAGLGFKTDNEWMEEVVKVSNKLSRNIAERPAESKVSKKVEELKRRAESSHPSSKDDILMLVENLNNIIRNDNDVDKESVIEILKQVEGMTVTGETAKKPIDVEALQPLTRTTLKLFADSII